MATCTATASRCFCELEDEHEGPHSCDCGGQWTGDIDGDGFEMVQLPGTALFGGLFT